MTIVTTLPQRRSAAFLIPLLFLSSVRSEVRTFNGQIDAASNYIHYSEGYLVAPGFIDLSGLFFSTLAEDDDHTPTETTTDDDGQADDDINQPSDDDGNHTRILDGVATTGSTVDVVVFHEPKECAYTRAGCDWTELGVGATVDGATRWCCSNYAIDLGFCDGGDSQYGRLIVNSTTFKGQHRFISFPRTGELETRVKYGKLEEPDESGKYIMIIANCNDEGRDIMIKGRYTWKSAHGYLPGDLFGLMYFFVFLAVVYLALLGWYGISMKINEDSTIPIQEWIFGTILLGFLETFFKTGDYFVWNEDGSRFWFAMYTGVVLGVMKRAISRCLLVMVSLGWGVVRDSLGAQMKKIVTLGIVYVVASTARDIMTIFAVTENETLSVDAEDELFDVVTILTFVVAAIDVTFYMWILDALNGTMEYLENMNQNMKLKRYLRLRFILLLSILFAIVCAVFAMVDTFMEETIVDPEYQWVVQAATELNYLMVLIGVCVLWRPNPSAKDYAFVMELPSLRGDGDETEGAVIPSAADDDEDLVLEESTSSRGYRDDEDDRLPIEDSVNA